MYPRCVGGVYRFGRPRLRGGVSGGTKDERPVNGRGSGFVSGKGCSATARAASSIAQSRCSIIANDCSSHSRATAERVTLIDG